MSGLNPIDLIKLGGNGDSGGRDFVAVCSGFAFFVLPAVAAPAIVVAVLAIRARLCRIPVSVGVVRGFRSVALPAAAALLMLYVAEAVVTLAEDAALSRRLEASIVHEGHYCAEIEHVEWPGPVEMPFTMAGTSHK